MNAKVSNTQAGAVAAAERDARTIYDIACIREARSDATREDVDFKAIALRNWQHVTAAAVPVEALEGLVAKMTQHVDHDGCACCHTKSWRDQLTQLVTVHSGHKERSNGRR